jgi:stearoyl-CoA desaturase (delta-9 desaturase)
MPSSEIFTSFVTGFKNLARNTGIMLRQWVDSDFHPEGADVVRAMEDRVDLKRTVPFIIIHLGCLAVFWVGFSWFAFAAALGLYAARMFAVTAFYHRYFSHRTFRTSRAAQFLFAVFGNTAMQRGPLWWASVHRHHHRHSDEQEDAHSPARHGFWWSHIGWITSRRNFPTDYTRVRDLASYPELKFLNRHDQLVPLLYGACLWGLGAALGHWWPALGVNGPQLFVWGFFISTVLLLHATFCINSLAHVIGRRRFETGDDSRNNLVLALVTLGEGWHNNHHRYAFSARQGFAWWEIDISYYILKMLSWTGLIWDLRPVPAAVIREMRPERPLPGRR